MLYCTATVPASALHLQLKCCEPKSSALQHAVITHCSSKCLTRVHSADMPLV